MKDDYANFRKELRNAPSHKIRKLLKSEEVSKRAKGLAYAELLKRFRIGHPTQ